MYKEALLSAAMSFHAWYGDVETSTARSTRLDTIATAIDQATELAVCGSGTPDDCQRLWQGDPRELAFLLLSQAYFETRLALHVHAGRCRAEQGECDSGKAISLWQLQAGYHLPEDEWRTLSGTDLDSTRQAALEAARALGRGRRYCGSIRGAISLYATGRSCNWEPAQGRSRFVRRLLSAR